MSVFDEWLYDHPKYLQAHSVLTEAVYRFEKSEKPFLLPVLGPTGSGKTELLRDVIAKFQMSTDKDCQAKLLYVAMPSAATGDALALEVIKSLIGPLQVRAKGYQIREMAARMLSQAGIRILVMDELNHLVELRKTERAQTTENRRAADWFKELIDKNNLSLILSGLPHTVRILSDNEQLRRRAMRPIQIDPYSWQIADDRQAFCAVPAAFVAQLHEAGWKITLSPDLFTRACYLCSSGTVGGVHKLMSAAEALSDRSRNLDAAICARAFELEFGMPDQINPFELAEIPDHLLHKSYQETLIKNSLITRTRGSRSTKD